MRKWMKMVETGKMKRREKHIIFSSIEKRLMCIDVSIAAPKQQKKEQKRVSACSGKIRSIDVKNWTNHAYQRMRCRVCDADADCFRWPQLATLSFNIFLSFHFSYTFVPSISLFGFDFVGFYQWWDFSSKRVRTIDGEHIHGTPTPTEIAMQMKTKKFTSEYFSRRWNVLGMKSVEKSNIQYIK